MMRVSSNSKRLVSSARASGMALASTSPRSIARPMRLRAPLTILLLLVTLGVFAPAAQARFLTGFFDPVFAQEPSSGWLEKTGQLGDDSDTLVRISVNWSAIARERPADARDPDDPAYNWARLDESVQAAEAARVDVLLSFAVTPTWAARENVEGDPSSWAPKAGTLGDFARALADRYDGNHPSSSGPTPLPAVDKFQVWNEQNISSYLRPQYKNGELVSPGIYRDMLNEAYAAINAVESGNFVVAGGFAPYGDPPGGRKTFPALFARKLLCLKDNLDAVNCPEKAKLDALDIHPYQQNWHPGKKATRADDIRIPDISEKLGRPLQRAVEQNTVIPAEPKELWATEFGWDTKPPTTYGISASLQKRYLAEAFYRLYREGVDAATWFRIVDIPKPPPELPTPFYGMGVYTKEPGSDPKPSKSAFHFMFVTERTGSGHIRYWGRAPQNGDVEIQRRKDGSWVTLATDGTDQWQVFEGTSNLRSGTQTLRAVMPQPGDDIVSPTWEQG